MNVFKTPRGVGWVSPWRMKIWCCLNARACQPICPKWRILTQRWPFSPSWLICKMQGRCLYSSGSCFCGEQNLVPRNSLHQSYPVTQGESGSFPYTNPILSPKVKVEVSHHKCQEESWANVKPLVFVLDAPQEPCQSTRKKGKKNQKGVQITNKNFGSWMSITKFKSSSDTLKLAWRCRLPGSSI